MGYFKNPEHEPIRVQKLNSLEARVATVETSGGGGGLAIDLDGGDATGAVGAVTDLDGGGASG
jgi:hypothetical protein